MEGQGSVGGEEMRALAAKVSGRVDMEVLCGGFAA